MALTRHRPRSAASSSRRLRRGWTPVVLFVCALAVYGVTVSHGRVSLDVWSSSFGAWHLTHEGKPWLDGIPLPFLDHNTLRAQWVIESHGHTVIARSPGTIAAALPAYLLLGGATFSAVPASLTAAAIVAAAVCLMFLALRRQLDARYAAAAALVFGFATPVWSVAADAMWPQTITVLGICGMAWACSTGRWWTVGVFGGITLWGRLHAAVIVAVLGLLVGWRRRDARIVLRVGIPSAAFLALQCVWTRWMYGTWDPLGSYSGAVLSAHADRYRFDLVNQLGMWVSPDRGILVWTPVLLVLLPALVRSWGDLPDWSRSLLYGGLVYTILGASLDTFTGGDVFYGYRYGLELLACATPALALAAPRMGRPAQDVIGPVVAVQLLAITVGATSNSVGLSQSGAWHDNAFASTIGRAGTGGWLLVGLTAFVGLAVGSVIIRHSRTADLPGPRQRGQAQASAENSVKPVTAGRSTP
jgi:alpha-1,2-mannosyltransferase